MPRDANPRAIHLKDYQPPPYLIDQVRLTFELHEQGSRVRSRLSLRRNPARGPQPELRLDGEGLTLKQISVDGAPLAEDGYRLLDDGLLLLDPSEQFELETEVEIAPESNTALEGLYRSAGMFCTQCEAEGFRRISYFLDRPDVMARFDVRIEADRQRYPVLLSNGNPGATGELADGRHFAEWHDPFPKPCYLFALVAGDLKHIVDEHVTPSGRTVQLRIYVEPENIDKCEHAMASLKAAMRWDEHKYGREYDLEVYNIVAVNDFNMGAMENKGLNIFNSKYVLARPDTATDADFQGIEGVIAHEYFHNWTGNRITCRDWFQLSLKEGFTVFRDQCFSADMGQAAVKRIEDVRLLRAHQFAEDSGPMAHPVRPASYIEINNFYTLTVYEKGAEVVRMQARLLGPALFRQACDLYFERHDGQAVTTDDFVACMAEASGRDLRQFKHWYDYAGTPELLVEGHYDAQAGSYRLRVAQHCPATPGQDDKPAFHIPFAMALLDGEGQPLPLRLAGEETAGPDERLLELTDTEQEFVFSDIAAEPVPSLLRGFSAPVKLRFDYSDQQLMFLLAHDNDGFARWDAAQTLSQRVILSLVDNPAEPVPEGYLAACRRALLDESAEPALIAELLTLPAESYLGDQMAVVEVEALHRAREQVRSEIAVALRDGLQSRYDALTDPGPYSPDAASIGRRALRNQCLWYLAALDDDDSRQLLIDQYGEQHNMSDVLVALALVADSDMPERVDLLADFEQRWADDALVMDKWFAVQAGASRPDTLARVRTLMDHPAFALTNPNKVRALIGAFCTNPVNFHAADGSGYAFLAEQVLALDPLNPQVAARLSRVMARWRRYDAPRQALMREQLERIVAAGVSKDVYEVASKSLGE